MSVPDQDAIQVGFERSRGRTLAFFWSAILAASVPLLLPYGASLWSREPYQFFPFAIGLSVLLVAKRWDRRLCVPSRVIGWVLIVFGTASLIVGFLLASPWFAMIGFASIYAAFLTSHGGAKDASMILALLPVLSIIKLPLGYDQLLVVQLQRATTRFSSLLLDILVVPHAVSNNVIQLSTRDLFVAEACSGIQSVFTLVFVSLSIVAVSRRPILLAPLYVTAAILVAVTSNVLRVTAVAAFDQWFHFDVAHGTRHEVLGYAALGFGLLLLLSFDHLITALFRPIQPATEAGDTSVFVLLWNWALGLMSRVSESGDPRSSVISPPASVLYRVLSCVSVLVFVLSSFQAANLLRPSPSLLLFSRDAIARPSPGVFTLDSGLLNGFRHETFRHGLDSRLGENADIWHCGLEGMEGQATIVLSQPYSEWHELSLCYERDGWVLLNRTLLGHSDRLSAEWIGPPCALARYRINEVGFAYLFFTGFDAEGETLVPPPRPGRLDLRLNMLKSRTAQSADVLMLQMLVVVPDRLKPLQFRTVAGEFMQARDQLLIDIRRSVAEADAAPVRRRSSPGVTEA